MHEQKDIWFVYRLNNPALRGQRMRLLPLVDVPVVLGCGVVELAIQDFLNVTTFARKKFPPVWLKSRRNISCTDPYSRDITHDSGVS